MINFQLNQSKPSISLLTFGNSDHKDGLTSFRIQCRIFLCWGKSATDEKCLAANRSKREHQEVQALALVYIRSRLYGPFTRDLQTVRPLKWEFRYQSDQKTIVPPLKPIGQTYVKVDNQAKVVATKITIDSRSPAVSLFIFSTPFGTPKQSNRFGPRLPTHKLNRRPSPRPYPLQKT